MALRCRHCGSTNVQKRGLRGTKQRIFCNDADCRKSTTVYVAGDAPESDFTPNKRKRLRIEKGKRFLITSAMNNTPVDEKLSVIIPAHSLAELNRLISDQQEPVELTINPKKSQVIFRLRNVEMVSQLIQGTFPNYEQLIPQAYSTRAVVKLSEFLRATRSASIFARDGSGIVRLQIMPKDGKGKIAISARAEEIGDNLGEVDAVVEGEETKIAFNSRYLMDVLGVLTEEEVALEATTSSSPGVIRPVGKDNYIHVVMPMFVQW